MSVMRCEFESMQILLKSGADPHKKTVHLYTHDLIDSWLIITKSLQLLGQTALLLLDAVQADAKVQGDQTILASSVSCRTFLEMAMVSPPPAAIPRDYESFAEDNLSALLASLYD